MNSSNQTCLVSDSTSENLNAWFSIDNCCLTNDIILTAQKLKRIFFSTVPAHSLYIEIRTQTIQSFAMRRDWQQLTLLTPPPPPPSPCQMKKKPATVAWRRSDCYVQRQAEESDKWSLYNALVRYDEEWQMFLTPASPPLSPCQIKKPTPIEQHLSDCFVQRKAAKSDK